MNPKLDGRLNDVNAGIVPLLLLNFVLGLALPFIGVIISVPFLLWPYFIMLPNFCTALTRYLTLILLCSWFSWDSWELCNEGSLDNILNLLVAG